MLARASLACVIAVAAIGCQSAWDKLDLERMIDQPPPANTIPVTRVLGPEPLIQGTQNGQFVSAIPLPLDRVALERGRNRYDLFCATCHAVDGSGQSQVSLHMELRKPPSLVSEPVRSYPVGRVFSAVSRGYGLMPEYSRDLSLHDRWAIVGYVKALQRSRESVLAALPENVRHDALAALKEPR
jgi:cytochrome c